MEDRAYLVNKTLELKIAIAENNDQNTLIVTLDVLKEIFALLKVQEAVEPYQHDAVWLCGNCGKEVVGWDDDIDGKEYRYPFCRQCGKAVKWNESDD